MLPSTRYAAFQMFHHGMSLSAVGYRTLPSTAVSYRRLPHGGVTVRDRLCLTEHHPAPRVRLFTPCKYIRITLYITGNLRFAARHSLGVAFRLSLELGVDQELMATFRVFGCKSAFLAPQAGSACSTNLLVEWTANTGRGCRAVHIRATGRIIQSCHKTASFCSSQ